jgi:anti-sigma factor RsiW
MSVDSDEESWGNGMTNDSLCLQAAQLLPGIVDGDIPPAVMRHLETCLRCQAEASRYRKIARELEKLKSQVAEPPIDLVAPVFEALEHATARRSKLKIAAVGIGVGSVVVALGTVAGIALKLRHRVAAAGLAPAS